MEERSKHFVILNTIPVLYTVLFFVFVFCFVFLPTGTGTVHSLMNIIICINWMDLATFRGDERNKKSNFQSHTFFKWTKMQCCRSGIGFDFFVKRIRSGDPDLVFLDHNLNDLSLKQYLERRAAVFSERGSGSVFFILMIRIWGS